MDTTAAEDPVRLELAAELVARAVLPLQQAAQLAGVEVSLLRRQLPALFRARAVAAGICDEEDGRPLLTVVVPAYNEVTTISAVLRAVLDTGIDKEVLVVDDGSIDGTAEKVEELMQELPGAPIRLLRQPANQGKGAALRRGFAEASGHLVLIQDADLEYDPADYPLLLDPVLRGDADVVFGSRFLGGPHRVLYFWHSVGNRILTTLSNMTTDLNLTDMETCFKLFRKQVIEGLDLRESGFGIEPELTAKIARGRWRIYEVPIRYRGRTYAEGKKIGWKDGLVALWCIVRYGVAG